MKPGNKNSYNSLKSININNSEYKYYSLTEAEKNNIHIIYEMGRDTDPPESPERNVAEYERMQGVLIRYPFGISTEMISEISEDITVYCLVSSNQQSSAFNALENGGVNLDNVELLFLLPASMFKPLAFANASKFVLFSFNAIADVFTIILLF